MSVTDSIVSTAEAVQEWALSALETRDEAVIGASQAIAGAIRPVTERFARQLPPVRPVVENWWGFAEKVLAQQKRFSADLLQAWESEGRAGTPASARGSGKKAA